MDRYIGITGFKTDEHVKVCKEASINKEPIIMYGILTSQKTLNAPLLEGNTRPALINLAKLLETIPRDSLPTIHHCTDNRQFSEEIDSILAYDNIYDKGLCKALQINQKLPNPGEFEKLKKNYAGLKMILALKPEDLIDPIATGKRLNDYQGLAEYVIIDPSRGKGLALNISDTLKVLNSIKINIMPVIAGGLSPDNVGEIVSCFRKEYGDGFCIDAQGKLRDESDRLSLEKMTMYVKEAYKAYR